jgi:hypothetical protein
MPLTAGQEVNWMKVRKGTLLAGSVLAMSVVGISWAQVSQQPTPAPTPVDMTSREIIEELKKNGHEFVIETTDIPKDRTYEVNLKDLKSEKSLAAIAKAMNLDLVREGDIIVMRSLEQMNRDLGDLGRAGFFFGGDGEAKSFRSMTPEERKKFDAAMKEVQEAMKDFDKEGVLKELRSIEDGIPLEMLEKAHREIAEAMEKTHGDRAAAMERAHEEVSKAMEKLHETGSWKELAELKGMVKLQMKADELAKLKDIKIEFDDASFPMIEGFGDGSFTFESDGDGFAFSMNSGKMSEITKSLSKTQLEKHNKQGYLLFSDLTDAQRKMLDLPKTVEGTIVLKFKHEGKEITLRSNRPK